MVTTKNSVYKEAYYELNQIIENLSKDEQEKIPAIFRKNLKDEMSPTNFVFDKSKNIMSQNIMVETKALLVEFYGKYLANDEERVIINQYRKISNDELEKEKSIKYSTDNMYRKVEEKQSMVEYEEENFFKKFISKIKVFFKKH